MAATQLGIPAEILDVVDLVPTFTADNTVEALRGSGIAVPEFRRYAPKLWRYWAEHLDPDRARRDDPAGPLVGRHVIITGASSGIGRASAVAVAERGRRVFALARNAEALDDLVAEIRESAAGARVHVRRHRLGVRRDTRSRTSSAGSATSTIWSTTRAGRSAGRSRRPPTGCTTTNA